MLPRDLLNELLTLLDDASTYRTFSLASRITSQLCRKNEVDAKKRFTVRHTHLTGKWCSLPNDTPHGPELSYCYLTYIVYLNGKREGPYWEWYANEYRYVSSHYINGLLHGCRKMWSTTGEPNEPVYYAKGKRVPFPQPFPHPC